MNRNHKKSNYGYYAALIVGIAALVVLVGVYTTRRNMSEDNQFVDLNSGNDSVASESGEEDAASVGASVADASNSDVADADSTNTDNIGKADLAKADTTSSSQTTSTSESAEASTQSTEDSSESAKADTTEDSSQSREDSTDTSQTSASVGFSKNSKLSWPVQGSVILPYSMDTTVYYQTIDAYKCNSGMIIQAKKGTSVYSAYSGTVKEVSSSSEYGKMVSVDIGGGYTAIYGQLADIQVTQGQNISQGTAIATIAKPSSMFTVEGANLYFALQKDGEYINPASYLQ